MWSSSRTVRAGAVALLALASASGGTLAQTPRRPPEAGWTPSATFTLWYQGRVALGGAGRFEAAGMLLRAGVDGPVGGGRRAGLSLAYDYTEYAFSPPVGQSAPWTDVHHVGLSAPFLVLWPGGWGLFASPSVDLFLEDGADLGEAIAYGAVVAVAKQLGQGLRLGIGVSVYYRLGEPGILPFPVVDWRITERLRLTNPLPAGPTGGAGLELSFQVDPRWTIGAGGAFRSVRFQLRDRGPFPGGAGEERAIPAFVHAGRSLGRFFALDLYAGALFVGRLLVDDRSGHEVAEQEFDPAPLVGSTLSARF
jgi:hypothetical protein